MHSSLGPRFPASPECIGGAVGEGEGGVLTMHNMRHSLPRQLRLIFSHAFLPCWLRNATICRVLDHDLSGCLLRQCEGLHVAYSNAILQIRLYARKEK